MNINIYSSQILNNQSNLLMEKSKSLSHFLSVTNSLKNLLAYS